MDAQFTKEAVLSIASKIKERGMVIVATDGNVFTNPVVALRTVRTKNRVHSKKVGLITLTEEVLNETNAFEFAENTAAFDALFATAFVPLTHKNK